MCDVYPLTSASDYSKLERTFFTRSRLSDLSCLVIGAGALGNEVARVLGLLGVGEVIAVDPDIVEAANLPRSMFFVSNRNAVGRNKASALVEAAAAMFPEVHWSGIAAEVADVGFQVITEADLLFSCGDSDLVRMEVAYISNKLRIPVVDAGLGTQNYSHGRVTYFPGTRDRACYCCMLTPRKRRELLEVWETTLHSCSAQSALDESDFVSTPTMASAIGAIQVELGLRNHFRALDGFTVETITLEIRLHPERSLSEFSIPLSGDCPFHERGCELLQSLPRPDCTIKALLNSTGAQALELDWPICTKAKCINCGHTWVPMLRLAVLRRKVICPACRIQKISEIEVLRTIGVDSPWAALTPLELGLPANHLHTLVRD
jgi:molybdopterin-synthase adenylyltransferase